jgi:hypothetical protein
MRRILLSLPFLMLPLLFALPALAGNWGEDWGTLTWGAAIAAVPSMGKLAVLVLVLALGGLAARFIQRGRAVASLLVIGLVVPMLAPVANAQLDGGIFDLHIFTDGTPALASEVNANFQALASAVNVLDCATAADVVCTPSCPACDTLDSFNQGFAAGGNGVDITSDNAAVCTTAGGTYDAGADSCSVDITTDNAAAEAAAGSAACTQAGGTWDAGTSTCTPAAAPYNCFYGGFCSQAAIDFPPADLAYTNAYDGHTQTTEPASGAGCNALPDSTAWADGDLLAKDCALIEPDGNEPLSCMPLIIRACAPN